MNVEHEYKVADAFDTLYNLLIKGGDERNAGELAILRINYQYDHNMYHELDDNENTIIFDRRTGEYHERPV